MHSAIATRMPWPLPKSVASAFQILPGPWQSIMLALV
jgi:hypothetical protein